jgi:Ser/Thr protein kinase RdoA (MazF antagonist)
MNSFPYLADFSEMVSHLAIFEVTYLLKSWELDCANPPDQSEMFVGHLEGILVEV